MSTPEFSRPFDRRGITGAPVCLAATAEECAALARRFGIVAIHRLEATLSLEARGEQIHVTGSIEADLVQACAVSGEDLAITLAEPVSLRLVPESDWAKLGEDIELGAEDLDEIPYQGTAFDLGEAAAQTLALAIDPYATGPGAETARREHGLLPQGGQGPLAEALARLGRPDQGT